MSDLMRFPGAARRDPRIDEWFAAPNLELRRAAQPWFKVLRACGHDVRELLHDGHPTACVEDAAFAYVDALSAHVNVGFFQGAALDDPAGLLQGSGKRMRHVKLRWAQAVDKDAVQALISEAYLDMRSRLAGEA
jgi:hypothetical protein